MKTYRFQISPNSTVVKTSDFKTLTNANTATVKLSDSKTIIYSTVSVETSVKTNINRKNSPHISDWIFPSQRKLVNVKTVNTSHCYLLSKLLSCLDTINKQAELFYNNILIFTLPQLTSYTVTHPCLDAHTTVMLSKRGKVVAKIWPFHSWSTTAMFKM